MRSPGAFDKAPGKNRIEVDGVIYRKGQKVRLDPAGEGADAADTILANKIATIEVIYEDYENQVYLAVTIDEDPGQEMKRDLGLYLYYMPNEVEVVETG